MLLFFLSSSVVAFVAFIVGASVGWLDLSLEERKLMNPYCQFSVLHSVYFLMIIPGFFVFMNF